MSHTSHNLTSAPDQLMAQENAFILPWYQQIIWSLLFGSMVVIAAGGNLIVIWIVTTHKRMRTVTNYFIVNLSVADTMVSTLNVIFNFIYMLNGDWPFGEAYCKFSNFTSILSVTSSVLTLMAISIDRYVAIMYPLKPRMSRQTAIMVMLVIWAVACLLALPNIVLSVTQREDFANGDHRYTCYMVWPDGQPMESFLEYLYNIVILIVAYLFPITSMGITYFRVGQELWGSQSIGEVTSKQVESIKSKRKIVKMMMVVVFTFAICWLPYHVYFIITHHFPETANSQYIQNIYLSIYFLAMSNSMYNPIIYCWMNDRFRSGFREVFCCIQRHTNEPAIEFHQITNPKGRLSCIETIETRINDARSDLHVNR